MDDGNEGATGRRGYKGNKNLLIAFLSFGVFVFSVGVSCLIPFFPKVADKKGMPITAVGFVITIVFVPQLLLAPFAEKFMSQFGPKRIYIAGFILYSISLILFAFTDRINNSNLFMVSCFGINIIQGLSYAMTTNSANFIVVEYLPDMISKAIGAIEMGSGIGYCIGPLLGGFLHDNIGYFAPFIGCCFLSIVVLLTTSFMLRKISGFEKDEVDAEHVSYTKHLIKIPGIMVAWICNALPFVVACFFDVFFSLYATGKLKSSPSTIGLCLFIVSTIYAISAISTGVFLNKYKKERLVMFCGTICTGAIFATIAVINLSLDIIPLVLLVGQVAFVNISSQLLFIPCLCVIQELARQNGLPENKSFNNSLSNFLSTSTTAGQLIGNAVAGIAYEYIGLSIAAIFFSSTLIIMAISIIIFIEKPIWNGERQPLLSENLTTNSSE